MKRLLEISALGIGLAVSLFCAKPAKGQVNFVSSDPAGGCTGPQSLRVNINSGHLSACIAGIWTIINPATSGLTNPMTSISDLIIGGAAGIPTRLAASTGYFNYTGSAYAFSALPTNSATATALQNLPTLCSSGDAARGILANGNATGCFTPSGGGGGGGIVDTVVASLGTPTPGLYKNVHDGLDNADCTAGGGSKNVLCAATGTVWFPISVALSAGSSGALSVIYNLAGRPEIDTTSIVPLLGSAWTQNGTVDFGGSTSTRPNRTATGSPVGRDNCTHVGETFFQSDGPTSFICTVIGTPGTWAKILQLDTLDNAAIGTTIPGGAPASSVAIAGKYYGDGSALSGLTSIGNLTDTYSSSGTVYCSICLTVPSGSYAAGTRLQKQTYNSTEIFGVDPDGNIYTNSPSAGKLQVWYGGTSFIVGGNSSGTEVSSNLIWDFNGSASAAISRDADNQLQQRRTTNAQSFRIANTYTDSTHYETAALDWITTPNTLTFGTQKGTSGGLARGISFVVGGTQAGLFDTAGNFTFAGNLTVTGTCTGCGSGVGGASNLTAIGAVPYVSASGVLNQDQTASHQFFWDSTNHRLGIGTATPGFSLDVRGSGALDGVQVINSGASVNLLILNASYSSGYGNSVLYMPVGSNASSGFKYLDMRANGTQNFYVDGNGGILSKGVTVANLSACASGSTGLRQTVTDSTVGLTAGIGATVAGGSTNKVPVFCDGTNWIIG